MKRQEPFALSDVFARIVQDADSSAITISRLSKYQYVLWQSRAFVIEDGQQEKRTRERLMRLDLAISSEDDLIARYESSIAYKMLAAARASGESLAPQLLSATLGLHADEASVAYCAGLIERHAGLVKPATPLEAQ